jgi:hypothetical protein
MSNISCILFNVAAAFRDVNHVTGKAFDAALMATLTFSTLKKQDFFVSAVYS